MKQNAEASPRSVRDMLARGHEFLEKKGVESARLEAELLIARALETDRLHVFLELDRPVLEPEIARARELLVRRGKHEPCAYVTGRREFYGRDFEVGPGVLVPRPETELLVDLGRERLSGREAPTVLDLGTGSGCLAITLELEHPGARATGIDRSRAALDFARRNAERLGVELELLEGDGTTPVAGRAFELVVCNPPYIDPADGPGLAPEVRDHEPLEALFAPEGDLDHWAHRLALEPGLLAPDGTLLVELGHDQAQRLAPWLTERGLAFRFHRDLAGIERVLELGAPLQSA